MQAKPIRFVVPELMLHHRYSVSFIACSWEKSVLVNSIACISDVANQMMSGNDDII
jgi:hypothetical protein